MIGTKYNAKGRIKLKQFILKNYKLNIFLCIIIICLYSSNSISAGKNLNLQKQNNYTLFSNVREEVHTNSTKLNIKNTIFHKNNSFMQNMTLTKNAVSTQKEKTSSLPLNVLVTGGLVSEYGKLHVQGSQLCAQNGQYVQLKGVSSHGIGWYPQFVNKNILKTLRDGWGANVFRIAMYTDTPEGYIKNPKKTKKKVIQTIEDAIALDMYVIIDWHILSDNDPNQYKKQAKQFFKEISSLYGNIPNVIYEICNEPNGDNITWNKHIKPYAETIISTIRKHAPDSLILCGTPRWCQDLNSPVKNPLKDKNTMYTFHFYAGTHKNDLRSTVTSAIRKSLPIFVSEWGTSEASGDGGIDLKEADRWLTFLESNGISWCNWALSDKKESCSLLKPGASTKGKWKKSMLTESGSYVKKKIKASTLASKPYNYKPQK